MDEHIINNKVVGLKPEYVEAVKKSIRDALQTGGSSGYPYNQPQVDIIEANSRPGEESIDAYAAAATSAIEDTLSQAGSVILEPIVRFEIYVPRECCGAIMNDLQSRQASIEKMDTEGEIYIIYGLVSLYETLRYTATLRSLTRGLGVANFQLDGYREISKEEVEKRNGQAD